MLRLQQIAQPFSRQIKSCAALLIRSSSNQSDSGSDENNPIRKTINLLRKDVEKVTNIFKPITDSTGSESGEDNLAEKLKQRFQEVVDSNATDNIFQSHCDVVIIGGGGVGSSVAFWLKSKARKGLNVVVIERDPTVL